MRGTISVPSRDSGPDLLLYWEDDTTGLPALDKEMIFGRGCAKNTGLGHFILREILDIPGIFIRVTGKPGKGVHFELTMPIGKYRHIEGLD